MLPVIQSGTSYLFLVQTEPQRVNQVELAACAGAEAGNVAGVGRYFRLIKDDMERGAHVPELWSGCSDQSMAI
jgi:hypothetical protein